MLLADKGELVTIAVKLTMSFMVLDCADLDAHTDMVMDEMFALESDTVRDTDLAATLTTGEVTISVVAIAGDYDAAAALANSTIRAAIHASNGSTPEWQTVASESRSLVSA